MRQICTIENREKESVNGTTHSPRDDNDDSEKDENVARKMLQVMHEIFKQIFLKCPQTKDTRSNDIQSLAKAIHHFAISHTFYSMRFTFLLLLLPKQQRQKKYLYVFFSIFFHYRSREKISQQQKHNNNNNLYRFFSTRSYFVK